MLYYSKKDKERGREMAKKSTEAVSTEYIHLNSCGCQHLFKDIRAFRPNGRRDYHILYITEGICYLTLTEEEIAVPAGSAIFFFPGEKQDYRFSASVKSTSLYLHFSGEAPGELFKDIAQQERRVFFVGKSQTIEELWQKLEKEHTLALPFSREVTRGYLLSILSLLLRRLSLSSDETSAASTEKILRVCRHMQTSLADDLPISAYAKLCHLSESRFTHLFREVIGKSPIAYLTEARIQRTKELLEYSALPIAEVGAAVGYANPYYFSRIFKKHTSLSPSEFRAGTLKNV